MSQNESAYAAEVESTLVQESFAFDPADPLIERPSNREIHALASWPQTVWPTEPIRTKTITRGHLLELRILIVLAALSLFALISWLLLPGHVGNPFLYAGLTLALFLRGICLLFEWYNYWFICVPEEIKPMREWSVDIFTTACPGEPKAMIVRTLKSMVAIRLPHISYLCDEGNDPELRKACALLGVVHVTRTERKFAKAGNINNALKLARGQIAVVLDPDHDPSPYLLERTLGYFEDPAVGFVQSVQAYGNQSDSFVAQAAAQQSYHFYGPFMTGTNAHGTTQAIGANCVFRRAALESIGGHAAGLAEDMHTAMRLYAHGWQSIYVPEILTRGLTPSTLAAFYKQQLKWACGTFDLLFQEYPKLFRSFTWRQALHYFVSPAFFLSGFIVFLEMLTSILCLIFGLVAWHASPGQIAAWFLPLVVFGTLVHLRAQHWLMEPHEGGMHFHSGLLTIGTWWIYIVGVVCAVFRIKIPYIPTPKEDEPTDAWVVALPNFIAAEILFAAAIYGLVRDSSPSAWPMALVAGVNGFALLSIAVVSQQVTLAKIKSIFHPTRPFLWPARRVGHAATQVYGSLLHGLRHGWALPGAVALVTVCLSALAIFRPFSGWEDAAPSAQLDTGGFYTGIDLGSGQDGSRLLRLGALEKQLDFNFRLVSMTQTWSSREAFPLETLKQLRRQGTVPMLNWLPIIDAPPPGDRSASKPILRAIAAGDFDNYLHHFAEDVRAFGEPVFISFAPQPDNPSMPWSVRTGNTSADFVAAWRHVLKIFSSAGASNVAWVWCPANPRNVKAYFPGEPDGGLVDWVGLALDRDPSGAASLDESYAPFRSRISSWQLPVMLLGQRTLPGRPPGWRSRGLSEIAAHYPEIRGVVLRENATIPVPIQPLNFASGAWNLDMPARSPKTNALRRELAWRPFSAGQARPGTFGDPLWFDLHPRAEPLTGIEGTPGHFSLMVKRRPFYIKGIAYNPSHDWNDANLPLSRTEIDSDFAAIAAMGGNTVRRYGQSWSDRVILNSAVEHHLQVLYGFWFMQDIDYVVDRAAQDDYQKQIESAVLQYRDHPGVLAWSLGNEVWGLLKHKYAQPYLTEVRHAHVLFVDRMSRRIKELDPKHPVFCAQESAQIAGAVSDYARGAPSLDGMEINSYYQNDIGHLDEAVTRIDRSRPYVVSEFGPDGYWDDAQNRRDRRGGLLEDTAFQKAERYANRWREFIQPNAGKNLGGTAYCWSDRYEGTSTWFGMNDLSGRAKPAVVALENAWQFPDPRLGGSFPFDGPRILGIDYPLQPQWPGEPFVVRARVHLSADAPAQFFWRVVGSNFRTLPGAVTPMGSGNAAMIKLPAEAGWYRVQVKVVSNSSLDEGDVPVLVQTSKQPGSAPELLSSPRLAHQ